MGGAMFEGWDAVVLARAQFAFTMSFHIVFPAFSIGLASYLAVLEALWLWTGREVFINLFNYWLKIFAVAFGMGVVSGIVMSYQFGTNWSAFSDKTGPVIGPLMAYEVLTAFFLEAGFLGVMLFGLERVGHKLHFFATLMVAVGTLISAFWILSANSWMQTPTGHAINADGQFVAADWFKVIFNPSFPYRLVHMVLAAYLTTALVVGAVGAWHLLRDQHLRRPARDVLDGDVDGNAGGADPDPRRRPARAQHAGASADQDHGDGRPFREPQGRRAADSVRLAGSGRRQGQIRGRNPQSRLADTEAFARRADGRARHRASRKLAAGADHVLVVPDHGRPRIADDGARPAQPVDALARHALQHAAAAHVCDRDGPGGLHRRAGGLDHHRDRAAAVHGLWTAADGRLGFAAGSARGRLLADRLHHRLFRRVHGRRDLYPAADGAAAASWRTGAAQPRPCPRRRHHAGSRRCRRGRCRDDPDRPSDHLGLHHRLCRVRLCGDGRFRSRARHPVSAISQEGRSRRHHEQRRAGLGRQRNLAGARRRRHDGGVPAGLCGADAGALHADDRDAARPGVPRRRL